MTKTLNKRIGIVELLKASKSKNEICKDLKGMLSNLVFSDEKKFNIEQHFNKQNNHVWLHDGEVGSQIVNGR